MARRPSSKAPAKSKKKAAAKTEILPIKPEILNPDHEDLEADLKAIVPASSSEVTTVDPLIKYLNDIRKYPLLTPQEEHELAVKYKESGDRTAAEKLVTSNLRFVVKIAAEYSKFGVRMIDLIQEGNVGLMHAVRQFNPYAGVKLITYAVWWIRGYIQEYLMKHYSMVKIGTTQAQKKLFYQLQREKALLDNLGQEAGVKLLSSKLGVTEQEVTEMQQRLSNRDLSLDVPMEDGGRSTFLDNQEDHATERADEQIGHEEEKTIFHQELEKIIPTLSDKERYILQNRVLGDPPVTLQEVGDHFHITRERARQLEERLLEKIKKHMVTVFPDYQIAVKEKSEE